MDSLVAGDTGGFGVGFQAGLEGKERVKWWVRRRLSPGFWPGDRYRSKKRA